MEDHEIQYQKGYEIAFLQVHFKTLLNSSEKDLIFEMNITKQCFKNAVKQGDFSQEFIDKFNYEKDKVLI